MSRKPNITEVDFSKIELTIQYVKRKEKESLSEYASRINRYIEKPISSKTLSRVLRSSTYAEYREIIKRDNEKKTEKQNTENDEIIQEETTVQNHIQKSDLVMQQDDILQKILQAVTSENPVNGSSVDRLSMNICGSLKKIKNELEKQTELMDKYFCSLTDVMIKELEEIKQGIKDRDIHADYYDYMQKLYGTFGADKVEEVKTL